MPKIKLFLDKYKSTLWFSIVLNLVILGGFLLVFSPEYETNDDVAMQAIASGFYGEPDAHLVFINYLVGLLLKTLYGAVASVPWYALLQYLVMFCSFTAITYVFLNRKCTIMDISLLSVFLSFFCFEGYVLLQFTKVASISACAGTLLLFWGSLSEKKNNCAIVAGSILLTIATMYRFQQAIVVCGVVSAIGLCFLLHERQMDNTVFTKKIVVCACSFLITLVMICGTYVYDQWAYESEGWREYKIFNEARAELMDYGAPNYEDNEQAFLALGIDRTAYEMLLGWTYEDFDKFTPETMVAMAELRNVKPINVSTILDFIIITVSGVFRTPSFYCFMILLAAWLLFGKQKAPQIFSVLFSVFVLLCVFAYAYFILSRMFRNRVDSGLWMAACIPLLFFIDPEKKPFSRLGVVILTCLLTLSALFSGTHMDYTRICSKSEEIAAQEQAVFDAIAQDKENCYFTLAGDLNDAPSSARAYTPFSPMPSRHGENIYCLGGWTARMPITLQVLELHHITNPIKEMINNENAYFIGSNYSLLLAYIQVWYDETVEFVYVKNIGEFQVYSVRTTS